MITFLILFYCKLNTQFKIHLKFKFFKKFNVLQIMNITITFALVGFQKTIFYPYPLIIVHEY